MITQLIWTPMSSVLKKIDKLNLSLSLSLSGVTMQYFFHPDLTNMNLTGRPRDELWPLLLTWFNFNPSMDK